MENKPLQKYFQTKLSNTLFIKLSVINPMRLNLKLISLKKD